MFSFFLKFSYVIVIFAVNFLGLRQIRGYDEDTEDQEVDDIFERYVVGATDDLGRLFEIEKQLIGKLSQYVNEEKNRVSKEDFGKIQDYLVAHDINCGLLLSQDPLDYVAHPINAYHLMKRTAMLWKPLFDSISDNIYLDVAEDYVEDFPDTNDFDYGAAFGLMSVQLYYNQSFLDMAKGVLTYPKTGEVFKSLHKLSSEDFLHVARIAKYVLRLDKFVEWTSMAVQVAKNIEKASDLTLRKLNRLVVEAKTLHDDVLIQKGLGGTVKQGEGAYDGLPEAPIFTMSRPFDEELFDIRSYQKSRQNFKSELELVKPFVDLRPLDEKNPKTFMEKSFHRHWHTMQPFSTRLCNDISNLRPPKLDQHLKCSYLHYNHPYLVVGPFKYEPLSDDPHVSIFRDFYSIDDCKSLIDYTHGKLHSTEYMVEDGPRFYTSQRVSKRHNVEEDDHPVVERSSKKLSLATRFMIHQRTYSAEDYKVINYGMGGHIEVHIDYWGPGRYVHPGGARFVTLLGYLSNVTAGGHTVFPSLAVSVKPVQGDLLLWMTAKNDLEYDSRMFHLGCPVMVGHKWVLTKWLYADDQMWNHQCHKKESNYPIFSNVQRHTPGFKV